MAWREEYKLCHLTSDIDICIIINIVSTSSTPMIDNINYVFIRSGINTSAYIRAIGVNSEINDQQLTKFPFQANQHKRTSLRAFQRIIGHQQKAKEEKQEEKKGKRPQSYNTVRSLPARKRSSSEPRRSHILRPI